MRNWPHSIPFIVELKQKHPGSGCLSIESTKKTLSSQRTISQRKRSYYGRNQRSVAMGPERSVLQNNVPSGRVDLPTCGLGNRRSIHTELRGRLMNTKYENGRFQQTSHQTPVHLSRSVPFRNTVGRTAAYIVINFTSRPRRSKSSSRL